MSSEKIASHHVAYFQLVSIARIQPLEGFLAFSIFRSVKPLHVIKIGGAVINDIGLLKTCLDQLADLEEPFVLVHGGGRKVNQWLEAIGHKIKMVEGRRITDEKTLEIAVMAYAGWINKQIVSGLQARNLNALGLSGADLNIITAAKRIPNPIDYGFVGDITAVNDQALCSLIEQDMVPVCCAITHDDNGQLLNTNADTIASHLAGALARHYETTLWYGFEKAGVLTDISNEHSLIKNINEQLFMELCNTGVIQDGMKPKLTNAFTALKKGVKAVHVFAAEKINHIPHPPGTKITLT